MNAEHNPATGEVFGRWTVKAYAERDKRGNAMFLCVCSCGKTDLVRGASLLIYGKETCIWMDGKEHIGLHNKARRKSK